MMPLRTYLRSSGSRSGFSLIELLAVMAIMVIVAGLTVAGFIQIAKSQAANSGAQQVFTTIKLARQYAVTKRLPVAFIVMDPMLFTDYSKVSGYEPMEGCAYAVFDLKNRYYLQPWKALPQNVRLNPSCGTGGEPGANILTTGGNRFGADAEVQTRIPFPTSTDTDTAHLWTFYGIRFEPDGRVTKTSNNNMYHWIFVNDVAKSNVLYGVQVSHSGNVRMLRFVN